MIISLLLSYPLPREPALPHKPVKVEIWARMSYQLKSLAAKALLEGPSGLSSQQKHLSRVRPLQKGWSTM